jgi:aminopeptidase
MPMRDPRLRRYAELLVNYCVPIKRGHYVMVVASLEAFPLAKEVYRALLKRKALPEIRLVSDQLQEILLKEGENWQIDNVSPFARFTACNIHGQILLDAPSNLKSFTNIPAHRTSLLRRARKPLLDIYHRREEKRQFYWILAEYPSNAAAQEAAMSLDEYEDFVFRACFLHKADPVSAWKQISRAQRRIVAALNRIKTLRITGEDTDLRLSVAGRHWVSCDGVIGNMPDGEILTSPVEHSAEGTIRFTFPAIYMNREVEDVSLRFRKGKVVEARARRGEDFLHQMLATDQGASRIGEIAIGTNPHINRFTKNMLFDEKMKGTIHLALGYSIAHTGGKNASAIHWDFLKDMHRKARIYADENLIYENGHLLI